MEKNCKQCRAIFSRKPRFSLKWWKNAKFCSQDCFHKNRIGKPSGTLGKASWNKGLKTGIVPSSAFKNGMIPWNKELKGKYRLWPNGREVPWQIGNRNHNWRGGYSKSQHKGTEYDAWRMEIYRRDGSKCRINNEDCNGKMEAHHILSFTKYPELRYQINNGITLCHAHHPRKRAEEVILAPIFRGLISTIAN